jgi:hypothetical protein
LSREVPQNENVQMNRGPGPFTVFLSLKAGFTAPVGIKTRYSIKVIPQRRDGRAGAGTFNQRCPLRLPFDSQRHSSSVLAHGRSGQGLRPPWTIQTKVSLGNAGTCPCNSLAGSVYYQMDSTLSQTSPPRLHRDGLSHSSAIPTNFTESRVSGMKVKLSLE